MAKAYSMDLRERGGEAVERGGLACNRAAARLEVAVSTAIDWVNRYRETGSVAPGQIGGHRPKKLVGEHRECCCGDAGSARSPCAGWSANWPIAA